MRVGGNPASMPLPARQRRSPPGIGTDPELRIMEESDEDPLDKEEELEEMETLNKATD